MQPTLQTIRARDLNPLPEPNDAQSTMQLMVGLRSHFERRDAQLAGCAHACTSVNVFPLRGVHVDDETGIITMPIVAPLSK